MRLVSLLLLLLPLTASAIPVQVTHQGRLLDPAGGPVNSLTTVEVALVDGGSIVWTGSESLRPQDGYYALRLG